MGNPVKGTRPYKKKLLESKLSRALVRSVAFSKRPAARALVFAERAKWVKSMKAMRDDLDAARSQSSRNMRACGYARSECNAAQHQVAMLGKKVAKLKERMKEDHDSKEDLMRENKALKKANKELEKMLDLWKLFWGWVEAHSNPGTLKWLQRLWSRGPRKAPDGCWGGGQ